MKVNNQSTAALWEIKEMFSQNHCLCVNTFLSVLFLSSFNAGGRNRLHSKSQMKEIPWKGCLKIYQVKIELNQIGWTELNKPQSWWWITLCNGAHHCIVSVVLLLSHAQSVHNFPVDQNFKTKMWELFDLLYSFQMIRTHTSTLFLTQLHTFIPV